MASRRSVLLAGLLAPLLRLVRRAEASPPPSPVPARKAQFWWTDWAGWVFFTVRLWEVEGVWRLALLDLPGHDPADTSAEDYPSREAAYGRACDLLDGAGYRIGRGFRAMRTEPDARRDTVEYHRIGSVVTWEVADGA